MSEMCDPLFQKKRMNQNRFKFFLFFIFKLTFFKMGLFRAAHGFGERFP